MSESGAIFTCVLGASLIAPVPLFAQAADTTTRVTFGAFVDGYYAWDRGRPTMFDRSFAGGAPFTTQPARHNEFNVNLAYVEAVVAVPRVRGRVALQAGTSVQANYAAEPTQGTVSGPSLARHLQEAYAGWQLAPRLWLDAGIFYSHMGVESWASKDNPSYTRSLVADYSPYYSAGVRAMWEVVPSLTARFDIVNGWQNVSETNQDKGGGLRLDWRAAPGTTLTYYGFVNGEAGGRLRLFNGVGAKYVANGTTLLGELDFGSLEQVDGASPSRWYGFTAVARRELVPALAVVGRVERYVDQDQVNIVTGLAAPFEGNGASIGLDVTPAPRMLWRTELRGFRAGDAVFPDRDAAPRRHGGFVVTSLATTF